MSWFGFGFNGFGQISPADVSGQARCKVNTPVLLSDVCRSDCRVSACWSSRADVLHTDNGSDVCVSGFVCGSLGHLVPESKGCTDASNSERYLTLGFTDRVECWEIQRPQNKLVFRREKDPSHKTGHGFALPLVSDGYITPRPPFFHPLCSELCAVSLALGTEHAVLLTASGTVFTWGSGSHGQLGHGTLTSQTEPQILEALWGVQVSAVSAGGWHSASVSAAGDLYMWGWNESGQLGLPSRGLEEEKATGRRTGNDEEEESKDVFISMQAFPALVDVPQVAEIMSVSCGSRHTAATTGTGDLYTWGWGYYGQLGHADEVSTDEPTLVEYFQTHAMCVKDVVCGLWNTFVSVVPKEQST